MIMKFAIVIFCCKRDEGLLPLCVEGVRRCFAKNADYQPYIFVQAETQDGLKVPDGCYLLNNDTSHNGNLIGLNVLRLMFGTYKSILDNLPDVDGVIKLDSDVILTHSLDWLDCLSEGYQAVGFRGKTYNYFKGTAYAMTRDAVDRVIAYLDDGDYKDPDNRRLEDETTTFLCLLSGCKCKFFEMLSNNDVKNICFTPNLYGRPSTLQQVKNIIDCGDAGSYCNYYHNAMLDTTGAKIRAMRFVLHHLHHLQKDINPK